MNEEIKPGLFISIEGMDGSGKSSIVKYLADKLNEAGSKTICTHEVGGTPIGRELRNICFTKNDNEIIDPISRLLMIYASRIQHIRNVIEPAILNGINVVSDRYNDSTKVYQGIVDNLKSDMDKLEAVAPLRLVASNAKLTIFLKIDTKTSFERGNKREVIDNDVYKNDYAKADLINKAYNDILDKRSTEYPGSVFMINANQSLEEVKKDIDRLTDYLVRSKLISINK